MGILLVFLAFRFERGIFISILGNFWSNSIFWESGGSPGCYYLPHFVEVLHFGYYTSIIGDKKKNYNFKRLSGIGAVTTHLSNSLVLCQRLCWLSAFEWNLHHLEESSLNVVLQVECLVPNCGLQMSRKNFSAHMLKVQNKSLSIIGSITKCK